jgi:hypothetical protein
MGRIRNSRGWLAWVAIVAVLGNVLAFASRHAPVQAAVDDMFGAHLNCTADGAGVPAPGDGRSDKPGHCAACTLLTGFVFVVALAFAAVAFALVSLFRPIGFDLGTLAAHLSLGGIRSRAPPVPA